MLPASRSPRARDAMTKSALPARSGATRRRDRGRIVGAVAVHENDDFGVLRCLRAGKTSTAVAPAGVDDLGAGAARPVLRAVAAASVGDDHAADDIARQFGNHRGDGFGFIEGRNDDGHARRLRRHGYRLQRNPQLAQASGGVFDLSALRKST